MHIKNSNSKCSRIKKKEMREFQRLVQYTPKHAKEIVDRETAWIVGTPPPFDVEKAYKKFRGR